jgi:hypothetical protein
MHFYSLPNIFMVMKSMKLSSFTLTRWKKQAIRAIFWYENLQLSVYVEDIRTNDELILNLPLVNEVVSLWTSVNWDRTRWSGILWTYESM